VDESALARVEFAGHHEQEELVELQRRAPQDLAVVGGLLEASQRLVQSGQQPPLLGQQLLLCVVEDSPQHGACALRGDVSTGNGRTSPPLGRREVLLGDQAAPRGLGHGGLAELEEDSPLEGFFAAKLALSFSRYKSESLCHGCEPSERWRSARTVEAIEEAAEDSFRCPAMDDGVERFHVAQACVDAALFLLEGEDPVTGALRQGKRHSELKWHVETRDVQAAGQGHPAEVVDRGTAARQEAVDVLEPALAFALCFQRAARNAPERHQAGDQSGE